MGLHNHDNEECPEKPVVVARLDARTPRLCVLFYPSVDGKPMNVFLCSSSFGADEEILYIFLEDCGFHSLRLKGLTVNI